MSGSCVDESASLMPEVRGEWADWLKMIWRGPAWAGQPPCDWLHGAALLDTAVFAAWGRRPGTALVDE